MNSETSFSPGSGFWQGAAAAVGAAGGAGDAAAGRRPPWSGRGRQAQGAVSRRPPRCAAHRAARCGACQHEAKTHQTERKQDNIFVKQSVCCSVEDWRDEEYEGCGNCDRWRRRIRSPSVARGRMHGRAAWPRGSRVPPAPAAAVVRQQLQRRQARSCPPHARLVPPPMLCLTAATAAAARTALQRCRAALAALPRCVPVLNFNDILSAALQHD